MTMHEIALHQFFSWAVKKKKEKKESNVIVPI